MGEIQNIGNYRGQNMGLRGSVYGWGGVLSDTSFIRLQRPCKHFSHREKEWTERNKSK